MTATRIGPTTIIGIVTVLLTSGAACGQTYAARGAVGFLQEWEIKADLAKSAARASDNYSGAITLRHIGLCSANGVEEKSGTVELKMSSKTADIEGTISLSGDQCRVSTTAALHYSGLLTCKSGDAIPIKLSIEAVPTNRAP